MWIEAHQELRSHPKTTRLSRMLKVSKPQAIGHLMLLWWWTIDYAPSGDLSGFTAQELALAAEWPLSPGHFKRSIEQAGWLDADGKIHDWHDYAGKLIARRNADRERKRLQTKPTVTNSAGTAQEVPGIPPLQYSTQPNSTELNAIYPPSQARESQAPRGGESRPPTLEVVLAWAEMGGVPKELAEIFFYHYDSIGWVDAGGNRISNPQSRLAKWGAEARAKLHQEKANGKINGRSFWQAAKELDLVRGEVKKIWEGRLETANGWQIDPKHKVKFDELKKRERELKKELNL